MNNIISITTARKPNKLSQRSSPPRTPGSNTFPQREQNNNKYFSRSNISKSLMFEVSKCICEKVTRQLEMILGVIKAGEMKDTVVYEISVLSRYESIFLPKNRYPISKLHHLCMYKKNFFLSFSLTISHRFSHWLLPILQVKKI